MLNKRVIASVILTFMPLFYMISSFCLLTSSFAVSASWNPEEVLSAYLSETYPWDEIEITNVQVTGNVGSDMPEKIVVEKGPIGKAVFSFLFSDNTKVIVRADVRAFEQVVRSRGSYRRGHIIRPGDLYVSNMNIRKMPNSTMKNAESLIGKSLKRSISANIPVVESMIEMSQVVKRGTRVVLMINQGGLNITAPGKIKEKGYVGMNVMAVNLNSNREVAGILIDENTVKVEL